MEEDVLEIVRPDRGTVLPTLTSLLFESLALA
jgi:hypothetical protein